MQDIRNTHAIHEDEYSGKNGFETYDPRDLGQVNYLEFLFSQLWNEEDNDYYNET